MKAHYKPDALIYQVGSWMDHNFWGPPELFPSDMKRPSLEINATHPGSDIAGQVAAAMAAASMVFAPKGKCLRACLRACPRERVGRYG